MPQKILVVEDEFIISLELQYRLQELGFEIIGNIASGEEAISLVREVHPDLILMDINLSGDFDGIETANIIHSFSTIPIIFITANSNSDILNKIKTIPLCTYLLKPFSDMELKRNLRKFLAMSKNLTDAAQTKSAVTC